MAAYLTDLMLRLAGGMAAVPEEFRARHAAFFLRGQNVDGGFSGREGPSDLYYTGFGLRGLALCGVLADAAATRAAEFLRGRLRRQETIVDFLSLIYGAVLIEASTGIDVFAGAAPTWRQAVADELEKLRRPDGGYAKSAEGSVSSTYHTFLVVLCLQLIDCPLVEPEKLIAFLHGMRRPDGGFVEIAPAKRSGANPTAAALAVLRTIGAMTADVTSTATEFLLDMQTDEGGFRANSRIPIADLLSTFTVLLTLSDLGANDQVDLDAVRRFVQSLENPDGGFRGAEWDFACDVEYSFYGLGATALLQQPEPPSLPKPLPPGDDVYPLA